MNLFLVHCGFYDESVGEGIYESHVNIFVAADDFDDAKKKVRCVERFRNYKMHIDGLQKIDRVQGWRISLDQDGQSGDCLIVNDLHRDL